MNDQKSRPAANEMIDKDLALFQLDAVYRVVQGAYSVATQAVAFTLAAEGVLLTLGINQKSSGLVAMGGVALVILSYLVTRGGRFLGSMAWVALKLEEDLGIPEARSLTSGYLVSFRSQELLSNLRESRDDQQELATRRNSKHSLYDLRNSRTTIAFLGLGLFQIVVALVMYVLGHWSL